MSTKSANQPKADVVEVRLKGSGVTTIGLVDDKGTVLMARRVLVSGANEIEAGFQMPLSLHTTAGEILAVPVLFHQTAAQQVVTIGGKDPAVATAERQRSLKLDGAAAAKIKVATQAAADQIRETGLLTKPVRS